jgi:hypothetical protein
VMAVVIRLKKLSVSDEYTVTVGSDIDKGRG